MKHEIIDLTIKSSTEQKKKVPIKLIRCLQDCNGATWHTDGYANYLRISERVIRISALSNYQNLPKDCTDLIEVDGCIFLGQWNDGVIE